MAKAKNHNLKLVLWILLFILVLILLFALGLVVGYAKLGGGQWQAIFQWETWNHIMAFWR